MARNFEYVDQPLVMRRYSPNYAPIAALYTRTGETLADIAMSKGANTARGLAALSGLYSNFIGDRAASAAEAQQRQDRLNEANLTREERKAERDARKAERDADLLNEKRREERAAARYMVDNTEAGPVAPALAQFARQFPETAARFTDRATLPARVTPGAVGEVSPDLGEYPVLEPSKEDMAKRAQLQAQIDRWAKEDARAVADDKRADLSLGATIANQKTMAGIAQQTANIAAQNAATNARRYSPSGLDYDALPVPLANALERSILTITPTKRKTITEQVNRLAAAGNVKEIKSLITQAALDTENVDTKNRIGGRIDTIGALDRAESLIKQMQAEGVPTGWFTGTVEDLARRIGKTTNPRLVEMANQLKNTEIDYRRSATGAAFGEKEGADYERMFANYRQSLPVNLAATVGLRNAMKASNEQYWRRKIGDEGYEAVFDAAKPAAPVFKPGDDPLGLGIGKKP